MISEEDREKAVGRNALLRSGQVFAPGMPLLAVDVPRCDPDGNVAPPTGSVSFQGRVRLDGREEMIDCLVGLSFRLVAFQPLNNLLTVERRRRVTQLGITVVVLGDSEDQAVAHDGTYGRFLAEHDSLHRPARRRLAGGRRRLEGGRRTMDELAEHLSGVPSAPTV